MDFSIFCGFLNFCEFYIFAIFAVFADFLFSTKNVRIFIYKFCEFLIFLFFPDFSIFAFLTYYFRLKIQDKKGNVEIRRVKIVKLCRVILKIILEKNNKIDEIFRFSR